ncbi:Spo0B domain-containing protein [Fonticella tunisiensis]|uniref:Sensor kinase SpoOB-type protein n=1 Tax=Fonticella tunisiensis TaxID=1096341 RepID=A0A4R7KSY4_9CLOT|nr:Spo0B domain-containing protein [Fonticella tunisiensis]TDT61212.1 sensor kinase SpoOB-type protein [Fonticella tunisiensis]
MRKDDWKFRYAVEQMRIQRHDFMNYLQIIYGYIQVNKSQEAVNYIKRINRKMADMSMVFNLECPEFSLLIQDYMNYCMKNGSEFEFTCELECISNDFISKNIEDIKKAFDLIKENRVFQVLDKNRIYAHLSGEPHHFKLSLSNVNIAKEKEVLYDKSAEHSEILYSMSECSLKINRRKNDIYVILEVGKN